MRKRSHPLVLAGMVLALGIMSVSGQIILPLYSIKISATPKTVTVGETVNISGNLTRILIFPPSPVSGQTVAIQARPLGGTVTTNVTRVTAADGTFSFAWTPNKDGTYEIYATWGGYTSNVERVTVNPPPFPWELVIGAAVGAVAVVAVVFFLMKRPKTPKPSKLRLTADPKVIFADGRSTSRVTVELLDGSNKPMAAEEDREVILSASDGTIAGRVMIPRGQSSAVAALTSSMRIGTVAVSAESGRLQGDRTEVTLKEKRRFCMHCGERMPIDARSCPRCGNLPPSGVDTKACKNCNEVIPVVAKYCGSCGAGQPS